MNNIIELKELCKDYPMGRHKVHALRKVNLSIEERAFVAITGTSGSGKSTLLHLIGALDEPTEGEVWVEDQNISTLREEMLARIRRDKIGYVFQDFCLIQELNVRENIILPCLLANRSVSEENIEDLCTTLGLMDRLEHMPWELSGGQQQRVAIARAFANNPRIILCDEPTGNLDRKTSIELIKLLHQAHEKYKKTVIVVTHDETIAKQADYELKMDDGRLVV